MSFCLKNHFLLSETPVTKHIDTMLLCLKNMSLKQYIVVSLCLKHLVLSTLILCYYVFKSMSLK